MRISEASDQQWFPFHNMAEVSGYDCSPINGSVQYRESQAEGSMSATQRGESSSQAPNQIALSSSVSLATSTVGTTAQSTTNNASTSSLIHRASTPSIQSVAGALDADEHSLNADNLPELIVQPNPLANPNPNPNPDPNESEDPEPNREISSFDMDHERVNPILAIWSYLKQKMRRNKNLEVSRPGLPRWKSWKTRWPWLSLILFTTCSLIIIICSLDSK